MSEMLDKKIDWLVEMCKDKYRDFKPIDASEIRAFVLEKNLDVEGIEEVWKGLRQVYEHKTMPTTYYFYQAYDLMFGSSRRDKKGSDKYAGIIRDLNAMRTKWEALDSKEVYQRLEKIYSKLQTEWNSNDREFIMKYSDVYFESNHLISTGMDKEGVKEHADFILEAINNGEHYRTRRGTYREATPEQIKAASKGFENLNTKNPR